MKKIIFIASAAILAASCCTGRPSTEQNSQSIEAQTANEVVASEPATREKKMIAGGYTDQRDLDADEKALFEKITAGLTGIEYTPKSVATQVVAGMNYRFICVGKTVGNPDSTIKVEIVVFQPLPNKGEPRITSITRVVE